MQIKNNLEAQGEMYNMTGLSFFLFVFGKSKTLLEKF